MNTLPITKLQPQPGECLPDPVIGYFAVEANRAHSLLAERELDLRVVIAEPPVVRPVTFGAVLDALAHGPVYLHPDAFVRFNAQFKARPDLDAKAFSMVNMEDNSVCVLWDPEVPTQAASPPGRASQAAAHRRCGRLLCVSPYHRSKVA